MLFILLLRRTCGQHRERGHKRRGRRNASLRRLHLVVIVEEFATHAAGAMMGRARLAEAAQFRRRCSLIVMLRVLRHFLRVTLPVVLGRG